VLDGTAPVVGYVTVVVTHLLAGLAHRQLGDQRAANQATERALALAEADRLVLPFAITGSADLPEAPPRHETAHAALLADILIDPAPARYPLRIHGHVGAMVLSAFPALVPQHHGAATVLTGLLDRSALYGVLAEVEALGLDLVEIRQLMPEGRSPESGDSRSA